MAGKQNRVVKLSINLPMSFPEDWTDEQILFYLNESSSCCDNRIDDLKDYSEKNGCICSITNHYLYPAKFDNSERAVDYAMKETEREIMHGLCSLPFTQRPVSP